MLILRNLNKRPRNLQMPLESVISTLTWRPTIPTQAERSCCPELLPETESSRWKGSLKYNFQISPTSMPTAACNHCVHVYLCVYAYLMDRN